MLSSGISGRTVKKELQSVEAVQQIVQSNNGYSHGVVDYEIVVMKTKGQL